MKTIIASALILAACMSAGCNLFNQHAQLMDGMRGVMSDTAARLSESGTGQIAAGGHVINPGLRVSGGVEYYAVAQYEGVSGQVTASMQGGLSREISPEVQARSDAIWRNTSLTDEQKRKAFLDLLRAWALNEPLPEAPPANTPSAPPAE